MEERKTKAYAELAILTTMVDRYLATAQLRNEVTVVTKEHHEAFKKLVEANRKASLVVLNLLKPTPPETIEERLEYLEKHIERITGKRYDW